MSDKTVNAEQVCAAGEAVKSGKLIVIPTDTVYGIACDPYSSAAVTSLLAAKERDETMPPPILVADTEQALSLANMTALSREEAERWRRNVLRMAERFWPGALTLVLPTSCAFGWDTSVVNDTVAVRVPNLEVTRELLRQTGPLAVTSANKTTLPPARTIAQAKEYFGSAVSVYVDGGPGTEAAPSAIVNCATSPWRVLRQGDLQLGALVEAAGGSLS